MHALIAELAFNTIYFNVYSDEKRTLPKLPLDLKKELNINNLGSSDIAEMIQVIKKSHLRVRFVGEMPQYTSLTVSQDEKSESKKWSDYRNELNDLSRREVKGNASVDEYVAIPLDVMLKQSLGDHWEQRLTNLLNDVEIQKRIEEIKVEAQKQREQEDLQRKVDSYTEGDDKFFYCIANVLCGQKELKVLPQGDLPYAVNGSNITQLKIDVAYDVFKAYVERNSEAYSQFFPGLSQQWVKDSANAAQIKNTITGLLVDEGSYQTLNKGENLSIGFQWHWNKFNNFEKYKTLAEFQEATKINDVVPPNAVTASFMLKFGAIFCAGLSLAAFALATVALFSGMAFVGVPLIAVGVGLSFGLASFGLFKAGFQRLPREQFVEEPHPELSVV